MNFLEAFKTAVLEGKKIRKTTWESPTLYWGYNRKRSRMWHYDDKELGVGAAGTGVVASEEIIRCLFRMIEHPPSDCWEIYDEYNLDCLGAAKALKEGRLVENEHGRVYGARVFTDRPCTFMGVDNDPDSSSVPSENLVHDLFHKDLKWRIKED